MEGDMIEVKVTPIRIFHPKNTDVIINCWGSTLCSILEVTKGQEVLRDNRTLKLAGIFSTFRLQKEYNVVAIEQKPSKYGVQYEVLNCMEAVDLSDEQSARLFLRTIFTERQVKNLYDTLGNPIPALEGGNIEELTKVPEVGEKVASDMIKKFNENKNLSRYYAEMSKYDLTPNMQKKLLEHYNKDVDKIIQIMIDNPYLITEVEGIGFKKADEIALKAGMAEQSPLRINAFIQYLLSTKAEQGDSYYYIDDILDEIDFTLGEVEDETILQVLRELEDKKVIWVSKDRSAIALYKYYNLEKKIAYELMRILKAENTFNFEGWEDKIKAKEQEQGWEFTEEQKLGIKTILENQITIIVGGAGCVDCDTEFFNGKEWKRIADYEEGDKVLQYKADGSAELVNPTNYIKSKSDYLWHFKTKYGLDQMLCDEHRVVYETSKGNLAVKPFSDIKLIHEKSKKGFGGKFYTTFKYSGQGIDLTDYEIRLMCAVICDGNFSSKTNYCHINLKKQRKKDRLEWILKELGISYSKKVSSVKGYHVYGFVAPRREKKFSPYWYGCNNDQLKIICDEILWWDGSQTNGTKRFSTTVKETADFVQFVFTTQGKRATILTNDRQGQVYHACGKDYTRKSKEYVVIITDRNKITMGGFHDPNKKTKIEKERTRDGYKYCFQVPSTMLVLRRNNRIFITGNCGKTSSVAGMLSVFGDKYTFSQTALSGRASCNMSDVTGVEGYTIHRLLAYNPNEGFKHKKDNPLEDDIIILDEGSMVGLDIFYKLVQAIKTGAKLIILGDEGQLEAIGAGNLLYDMIDSGIIPMVRLTKVHRQAEKSAIITEANKIRQGEQITEKGFIGAEIRGELKDLEIDVYKDKEDTQKNIIKHYKELLDKGINYRDIQVILPVKDRGEACTSKLNNIIQKIVIDTNHEEGLTINPNANNPITLYVGDKVMQTKNNYQSTDECSREVPIYNGDMGTVVDVDRFTRTVIVNFFTKGRIIIKEEDLFAIDLAYACTTHKLQGSSSPYVICGIDYSHYMLLCRQMLYTMLTRAKKYCVLCAESKALRHAIRTDNVVSKQTFLTGFLKGQLPLPEISEKDRQIKEVGAKTSKKMNFGDEMNEDLEVGQEMSHIDIDEETSVDNDDLPF